MSTQERTWQYDVNRVWTPASAVEHTRYQMWYLKAFLKGEIGGAASGLWTCVGSSDAVTANVSDNTDRWGSPYNGAKIVRANAGTAHSWIVLKSPNFTAGGISATPFYMLLDFGTTADANIVIAYSKVGFTGGTTLARPTATDEWGVGQIAGLVPTSLAYNDGSASAPYRVHGILCTDGSFCFLHSKDGSGVFQTIQVFSVLANVKAADAYPVFTLFCATPSGWPVDTAKGIATPTFASAYCTGRNYAGTVCSLPVLVPGGGGTTTPHLVYHQTGTGTWSQADGADGSMPDFPFWVATSGGSNLDGIKGRLQDFALCPVPGNIAGLPIGAVEPASGTITSVNLGGVWAPFNAAPTL